MYYRNYFFNSSWESHYKYYFVIIIVETRGKKLEIIFAKYFQMEGLYPTNNSNTQIRYHKLPYFTIRVIVTETMELMY